MLVEVIRGIKSLEKETQKPESLIILHTEVFMSVMLGRVSPHCCGAFMLQAMSCPHPPPVSHGTLLTPTATPPPELSYIECKFYILYAVS